MGSEMCIRDSCRSAPRCGRLENAKTIIFAFLLAGPTNHRLAASRTRRPAEPSAGRTRRDLKEPLNCFVRVFGRASCVPVQTAKLNAPTPKGASLCESLISRLLRAQMGDL